MSSWSDRPGVVLTGRRVLDVEAAAWSVEDLAAPAAPEPVAPDPEPEIDLEAEREAAYQKGFRDGRAAGVEEGRREEAERLAHAVAALEAAAAEVRAGGARWLDALEANIAALAVAVARHVIGRELKTGPEPIVDLVRRALMEFPVDQPLRVLLNPGDLSAITAVSPSRAEPAPIAPGRDVRWVADPSIEPGGCIVEGRDRIVDGRIDRALERIWRSLADG